MITKKTIKDESTNKNYFNDNYSYIAPASLITYLSESNSGKSSSSSSSGSAGADG